MKIIRNIILLTLILLIIVWVEHSIEENIAINKHIRECPQAVLEINMFSTDGFYYKNCDTIYIKAYKKNTNFRVLLDSTIGIDTFPLSYYANGHSKDFLPFLRNLQFKKTMYTNQDLFITLKDGRKFKITDLKTGIYRRFAPNSEFGCPCEIRSCKVNGIYMEELTIDSLKVRSLQ